MYDEIRRDPLNNVNAVLLPHGLINLFNGELINIPLYNHESLSLELNAMVLSTTLDYIQISNRFEYRGKNIFEYSPHHAGGSPLS